MSSLPPETIRVSQNGSMPARRERHTDMPLGADRAFRALSSRARIEVMKALGLQQDQTRPQLAEATGLTPATVRSALEDLEDLSYVTVSEPPGSRHGRPVTYRVNRTVFQGDLADLAAYVGSD